MKKGLIHIYIGKGKGKTTTAVGVALRAYATGKRVCLIQFLKARLSSEMSLLKRLGMDIVIFRERHPLFYKNATLRKLKEAVITDLIMTDKIIASGKYDLIVFDEILYLLKEKLISEDRILNIIRNKPVRAEFVFTGAAATKKIIHLADYACDIKCLKHPFNKGVPARKGIEY